MKWCLAIIAAVFLIIAYNTRAEDERWGGSALISRAEYPDTNIGHGTAPVRLQPQRVGTGTDRRALPEK